ncbi:hypothetical protein [Rhodopseudomonas sp. B29]|uniref:hypothetical protein n=1 Tax=Rhodopseudomonas sp. B29 TaxID=95607 RepID=UPI000347ADA2|nr:hypothetical protein [Rhodopseudomonas sp. B29]
MWTPEIVRQRFVEAADVERRLPRVRGPRAGSFWPGYGFTEKERAGWTEQDQAEDRQRWAERRAVTASELSRYSEVVGWTIDRIGTVEMRHLVWCFTFCQVIPGRSFVSECNRRGWARSTAYARLERLWISLANTLGKAAVPLRAAGKSGDGQIIAGSAPSEHTLAQLVPSAAAVPNKPFRTEPSRDLPEARDFEWAQDQSERAARRRRKLGLEDAA